ncbi:MAG: VWA domain-containing protein [Bacteroidota bacterium]
MGNLSFANPELLWLLLLLPLLGWWFYQQRESYFPVLRMSSTESVQQLVSWRGRLRPLLWVLRAFALAALIIAIARPREALKEEKIKAEGIDIVLAMDLSSSMLARDFPPDRLEVSKKVAARFIDRRPYDRIGLVAFAGESYTQCPLTTDHEVLKTFLAGLQCGVLEDGTAIGMGLASAVNRLEQSDAKSKVVILLTDGVNNSGYIKPITAAQMAKVLEIKAYTIGVGSTGEARTPVSRQSDGRYRFGLARVEIDEALLREIAQMTGGKYFRATSAEGLEAIYQEIDQLEKTEIEVTTVLNYSEEFHRFALAGLILLLLELLLRYTILRAIP